MSVSQDRNQENRFRPFSTTVFLCDLEERVTIKPLKVKRWRISNIVSRQVKINKVRFFFPDRIALNPLLHDSVRAKGDIGSKTDQMNSSKKYVKKKIEILELEVYDTQTTAILNGIPGRYYSMLTLLWHSAPSHGRMQDVRLHGSLVWPFLVLVHELTFWLGKCFYCTHYKTKFICFRSWVNIDEVSSQWIWCGHSSIVDTAVNVKLAYICISC